MLTTDGAARSPDRSHGHDAQAIGMYMRSVAYAQRVGMPEGPRTLAAACTTRLQHQLDNMRTSVPPSHYCLPWHRTAIALRPARLTVDALRCIFRDIFGATANIQLWQRRAVK